MKKSVTIFLTIGICIILALSLSRIAKKNTWKWEMLRSENSRDQIYEAMSSQGRITIFSPKDNSNLAVELAITESRAFGRVYRNLFILENKEIICNGDTLFVLDKLLGRNAFSKKRGCPEYIKKKIEDAVLLEMKRISWMLPSNHF